MSVALVTAMPDESVAVVGSEVVAEVHVAIRARRGQRETHRATRRRQAVSLRLSGATYGEIGEALGVSGEAARKLYRAAIRDAYAAEARRDHGPLVAVAHRPRRQGGRRSDEELDSGDATSGEPSWARAHRCRCDCGRPATDPLRPGGVGGVAGVPPARFVRGVSRRQAVRSPTRIDPWGSPIAGAITVLDVVQRRAVRNYLAFDYSTGAATQ